MAELKTFKVTSLPGTLVANAFYFVLNGDYAEFYLTDSSGEAKAVGNTAMITAIAGAGGGGGAEPPEIVTDIAARDALTLTENTFVLVKDATDDPTVNSGAAMYLWDSVGEEWIKLTEYESLDVVVSWSAISGRPSSSPTDIDSAVSQRHTHANKTVLDSVSDSAGVLQYLGQPVDSRQADWNTVNW